MTPMRGFALVFMAGIVTLTAGCTGPWSPHQDDSLQPVQFTGIWIGQGPPIPVDALAGATGYITACTKVHNPNPVDVVLREGYTFYHVRPGGLTERLDVVQEEEFTVTLWAETESSNLSPTHFVLANETAAGAGSTRYAIHVWHEVVGTYWEDEGGRLETPLREEKWFNVTFVPFSSGTLAQEGERCP